MAVDPSPYKLSMGIPNGIILALLGILVLVTPLAREIPPHQVPLDIIAGGALLAGGIVSFLWGLRARS